MPFGLFKKKKEDAPPLPEMPPVSEVPVDQVISLQQQGLTNEQIIATLQRQGYSPQQIYDAFSQTEARKGIEPYAPESQAQAQGMAPAPSAAQSIPIEDIERIIEEKWHELTRELGKFSDWKDTVNSRLDKLEQGLSDARSELDNLHKAIISKIGEYDKNLLDVGTEVKAMEKVFQKVLPELTGSIQEFSRLSKSVSGKEKKK